MANVYENLVISGNNTGDLIREKYFELLDEVVLLLDLSANLNILDIGIGTGFLTEKLPKNIHLHGIDISSKMMNILKRKKLNVTLKNGSFLNIPYDDNTFDRVVSTYAFHHVPYELQNSAINEMNRVLKSGGSLIVGDLMFENKQAKKKIRSHLKSLGKNDTVLDIDDEFFAFINNISAFLSKIGFNTNHKRISTLSWIIKAIKNK